jgi:hypothetical protein
MAYQSANPYQQQQQFNPYQRQQQFNPYQRQQQFNPQQQAIDPTFQNMSQADRMRAALDDSGMGRGGYQQRMQNPNVLYTPDHYQQQRRFDLGAPMTMDMPQYGGQQAGLAQLMGQMQRQLRGSQTPNAMQQQAQQAQQQTSLPPGVMVALSQEQAQQLQPEQAQQTQQPTGDTFAYPSVMPMDYQSTWRSRNSASIDQ